VRRENWPNVREEGDVTCHSAIVKSKWFKAGQTVNSGQRLVKVDQTIGV